MDDAPLTHVSVLVVDDHEDTRTLLDFVLRDAGALVTVVNGAEQARAALRVSVPDVVVIDLQLAAHDGYWVLDVVRSLPAEKRVWLIAATARADAAERALSAGFDAYLTKPFPPHDLVTIIERFVRGSR